MSKLGMVAVIAVAATIAAGAVSSTASASSTSVSCSYRAKGAPVGQITFNVNGPDNTRALCQAFNGGFHGTPTSSTPGRLVGVWKTNAMNVYVRVYATSWSYGRAFATLFDSQVKKEHLPVTRIF